MPSYPPKQALIQQHIRSTAVAAAAAAAAAAHTPKLSQSAPPSTAQHAHAPPPTPPDLLASSEPRVVELRVDNMTCHKCIGRVERALKALPGVLSASADLTAARARVEGSADVGELLAALQQAGYPACHITGISTGISTGITGIPTGITGTKDSTEANTRAAPIDCDATSNGVVSKAKGGGVQHGIHPFVPPPPSVTPPPPSPPAPVTPPPPPDAAATVRCAAALKASHLRNTHICIRQHTSAYVSIRPHALLR
jgi:copper chaperone CopZ